MIIVFTLTIGNGWMLIGATLSGKIIDEASGTPVAGITVWLENTNYSAVTDAGGNYLITNIPDEIYTVIIDGPDYQQKVFRDFGVGTASGISDQYARRAPDIFVLYQNYPNPFNPATTISYHLPAGKNVLVEVRDMLGRRINTLLDGWQSRGIHYLTWDGRNSSGFKVASGIYYYTVHAGEWTGIRKMLFVQ